jgi:protocatechuate 3,4-dioxygenase beta subunit
MFSRNIATKKRTPTPAVEEGPYYKSGSPERRNIAGPGTNGISLIIEGRVLDTHGKPVPRAWMDFWQADGLGQYDNTGFNLRGHQYTEKDGRYRLETVMPLGYESRSPHVHAKVRAADDLPTLTTQLFFAGDIKNATDFIFEELTAMNIKDYKGGLKASFDFIIETGRE